MMTITSPKTTFVMMSGERPIINAVKVRMHNGLPREHKILKEIFHRPSLGQAGVSVSVL